MYEFQSIATEGGNDASGCEIGQDTILNPIVSSSSSALVLLPNPLVLLAFMDNSLRRKLLKTEIAQYLGDSYSEPRSFNNYLAKKRGENDASKKIDALYCQESGEHIVLEEILSALNLDLAFLSGLEANEDGLLSVQKLKVRIQGDLSNTQNIEKMLEFFQLLKTLIEPDWLKLSILCDRVDDKNLLLLFRLIEKFVSDHSEKWGSVARTNAYLFLRSQHQHKPYVMPHPYTLSVICTAGSFDNPDLKDLVACIDGRLEADTQAMIDVINRAIIQEESDSILRYQQIREVIASSNDADFYHKNIPSYKKALALSKIARKFLKDLNNVMMSKEITKKSNLIILMQFLICISIFQNVCNKSVFSCVFWYSNHSSDVRKNAVLSFLLFILDNLKPSLPFQEYKNNVNACFLNDAYHQSGLLSVLSIEEYKKAIASSTDLQAVRKLFPREFLELIEKVDMASQLKIK